MEVADCVADPLDDCSQMQPAKLLPLREKDGAGKGHAIASELLCGDTFFQAWFLEPYTELLVQS